MFWIKSKLALASLHLTHFVALQQWSVLLQEENNRFVAVKKNAALPQQEQERYLAQNYRQ
jgi:hypothetical protein